MGRSHNQDHYKVSGTEIESRGISARDRQRMAQEEARLQRKASSGVKPPASRPRTTTRKAKANTRRKATQAATPQAPANESEQPEIAQQAARLSAPRKHAESTPTSAEVVSIRKQRAAQVSSVAPRLSQAEPTPGLLGQVMRTASLSGRIAGRLVALATDVVAAPWTIIRLVRQTRRREA